MNNPGIRHYERELGKAVRGSRRRKRVIEAFQGSLLPFLEEQENPTYNDLMRAFGPPEQMAQELIEAIPDLPNPLRTGQKIGIVIGILLLVVLVCGGVFYWFNMPECEVTILNEINCTDDMMASYTPCLSAEFSQTDTSWRQSEEYKYTGYLLIFENTNQIETKVMVKYSDHQPPHYLVVPAGEQRVLQVDDARPTEHTTSFSTSDGSMSGTVQVLLRLPS